MRRALLLVLTAALLAGCGSDGGDDATTPEEMNETDNVTIASGAGSSA